MEKQLCTWRKQAVGLGHVGRGSRYPGKMRAQAVGMCRAYEAGGGTVEEFAKKLGVPSSTLWTWRSRAVSREPVHGALVPVTVVGEPPSTLVRVQLGSAHVDVDLAQLAELVRRLS